MAGVGGQVVPGGLKPGRRAREELTHGGGLDSEACRGFGGGQGARGLLSKDDHALVYYALGPVARVRLDAP